MLNKQLPPLTTVVLSTSLLACAGGGVRDVAEQSPSIETIYSRHVSDVGLTASAQARASLGHRGVADGDGDLRGFVREAYNELDVVFPKLPNPSLVMFVFPHLAGVERVPIPGYATTFPLYARDEYALPGEATRQTSRSPVAQ